MTPQSHKFSPNQRKPSGYLIDPLFLTQMELLAVNVLKFHNRRSHQIPNFQGHQQKCHNLLSLDANHNKILQGAISSPVNESILNFINPPSSPQVLKVYMLYNQKSFNIIENQSATTSMWVGSKINNTLNNQNPVDFPPTIYVPSQTVKEQYNPARSASLNPNDTGLHYLKGTSNHPQTSTIQVDGEKRIIVQIKRDSNKITNIPQNLQNANHLNSRTPINHSSGHIYEGWDTPSQNGNYLSQGQNFMNQGNAQKIYLNHTNQTHQPKEMQQKCALRQNFSLVQQKAETNRNSHQYFSFGKNENSNTKNYNTPFKILESNKEESSENNEDLQEKKSQIVSYKRANVGDSLQNKHSLIDNFNKLASQRQQRDLEEKEVIERKKIEKRKKQTRKLLLGEGDSDEENKQQKTVMNPIPTQYDLLNQKGSNNQETRPVVSQPYANQVISIPGLTQENQKILGVSQVNWANNSSMHPYNQGNKRIYEIPNANEPKRGNIYGNGGNLIQSQKVDSLINRQDLGNVSNGQRQHKQLIDYSDRTESTNQFYNQPIDQRSLDTPSTHQNLPNLIIPTAQSHQNPLALFHQNTTHRVQPLIQQSWLYNSQKLSLSQPNFSSQNSTFPTPTHLFQFIYYKELERQQNQYNIQPKKQILKEKPSHSQSQICSYNNFAKLFQQFQQLIHPSQQDQSIPQNHQPQGHAVNSFDAISQRIQAKLFLPQNLSQGTDVMKIPHNEIEQQPKWRLDLNLPIKILIDLMYKYQCKLNQALIKQAQIFGGCQNITHQNTFTSFYLSKSFNLQSKPKENGLIDYINQISNGNLNKRIEQVHTKVYDQLEQVFHSIPKNQIGIKINAETGNVNYPKKQELSTSDLSLYQYVQNCMQNYNQITNDPLFNLYNYDQLIFESLKKLIQIKRINHSHTINTSNKLSFQQILYKSQPQKYQYAPKVVSDPTKMTQFIDNYLNKLDYLSLELDEKVNIILYDLNQLEYKPSANFYGLQSKPNCLINAYPHFFIDRNSLQEFNNPQNAALSKGYIESFQNDDEKQLSQEFELDPDFSNSYLNEIRNTLSFTGNVEKQLRFFPKKYTQSQFIGNFFPKTFNCCENQGGRKSETEMVDQEKINKMNEFFSSIVNILSRIESDLEIMNSQIFSGLQERAQSNAHSSNKN